MKALTNRVVALRAFVCTSLLVLTVCCSSARAATEPRTLPSFAQPAISPDGNEIAFVSGAGIWTVPAKGGEAHLLVSDGATVSRPLYSPDGKALAFISSRTGNGDIYVLTLQSGEIKRLTYSDASDQLDAWSRDGKWIYFTSSANDVAGQGDIFRVSVEGGTPLEVSRERYLNEFESAPSPDGTQLALIAKGISSTQWWRNGHSHIDESEIWLKPVSSDGGYRRLVAATCKHAWPMWSTDGKTLFYMSDASGAENLWSLSVADGRETELTHFKSGRVLWPTISSNGSTIVFERNLAIWKMDVASRKAEAVSIVPRGTAVASVVRHEQLSKFTDMALSPDGKKIAVIAHGEIFAASAKDGGDAARVTHSAAAEEALQWSSDSKHLAYQSERNGHQQIFEYDFTIGQERELTPSGGENEAPVYSPDGKSLAYVKDEKELHVLTLSNLQDRVIATDKLNQPALAWSPDGQWLAFTDYGINGFRNIKVVPATGGRPQSVSFLANGETAENIAWSPDGAFLLFETAQRSEQEQMARVDLKPHVPRYREDEFRDLFKTPDKTKPDSKEPASPTPADSKDEADKKPDTEKKPEPTTIVFEGIRNRLTFLPIGLDISHPVISPDGKIVAFAARVGGQANLYSYSLDELSREPAVAKQLTSTPGQKSDYRFSADSKEVFYLENEQVHSVALESKTAKTINITASMDVNFDEEKKIVFEEAWGNLNRRFYDADFHGHNWKEIHDEFAPYAAGSKSSDELRRDIGLMIGELNSSHSGIRGPMGEPAVRTGRIGLRFERVPYEAGKGLVIREVIVLGPAANEGSIKAGEMLVAVNGHAVDSHTNLDELLADQVGKKVVLKIASADGSKQREAVVLPVSTATETGLVYRQWVEANRAYVEKLSDGKLGYVHIPDMGDASLRQLYIDLDAQNQMKQGVVIDIRNNNGGYINGYALDVFSRKNFLTMTWRGLPSVPSRQALGQRALGLPTILLTNESSLSDAEDFTEGYRTLKLGKVIGTPTAGWIIYTGGTRLIDGSQLRLPQIRIQDLRGQTMELHPRPVDVEVERQLGETIEGRDAQLEKAVTELTEQLSKSSAK